MEQFLKQFLNLEAVSVMCLNVIDWKSTIGWKTPSTPNYSRLKWILHLSRIKFGINCTTFKSHIHFGMMGVLLNTLCSRDRMEIQRTYKVFYMRF